MGKDRFFKAKGFVDKELTRRVGQVFFRTDNMGNMHQIVVNDHGVVIGRNPITFYNDEVANAI